MKRIQLNDHIFPYLEDGSGSPLILVHGSLNDYRSWGEQVTPFAEKYHVIAYSRRYHYPDQPTATITDYSFSLHADDLIALIEALKLAPANIVGASYGGYSALLTALKKPDLVKTMVLVEPPVLPLLLSDVKNPLQILLLLLKNFSAGRSFLNFGMKALEPAKKRFNKGYIKEGIRLFTNGVLGKGSYEELSEEVKASLLDNAPALRAELFGPGFPPDFPKKEAARLQIPTLLVKGSDSPRFFHAIADELDRLLPLSHQIVVPDTSHDIHQQQPEAFNEQVFRFLSRHN